MDKYKMNKRQHGKKNISKNEIKMNSHYNPLSPTDRASECDVYLESLEWALRNKSIKNIAISGPYGSGKSSIIQTFEKEHKKRWYNFLCWNKNKYTFLNISLATFREEKNDGKKQRESEQEENKEDILRLIELSIVQ